MKSFLLVMIFAVAQLSHADLIERIVDYKSGDQNFEGYLVYKSDLSGKAPGVLVVHDWMGLTDKTKAKAQQLAEMGYIAFAADIYGRGVRPADSSAASAEATKYKKDRKLFRERLNLALKELKTKDKVDTKRLAAIGFCFGGTGVVELARSGADLKGIVSFHGGLDSPEPDLGAKIKARVLALHGADDPFVQATDLKAFEEEMRKYKIDWQLIKYGGAVHSFTDKTAGNDNSKGAAYNAKADQRSWQAMKDFFGETL